MIRVVFSASMANLPTNGRVKFLSKLFQGELGKFALVLFFVLVLLLGLCSPDVLHHLLDVIHGKKLTS